MKILIELGGVVSCIYDETIDLSSLGRPMIQRASRVEPNAEGRWIADLSPVNGPILGPFNIRSEALTAELTWLDQRLFEGCR
jgi:hypothetical protein